MSDGTDDDLYSAPEGATQDTSDSEVDFRDIFYSNEGRNYPTEESTQGEGGSPFNASYDLANQINWGNLTKWLTNQLKTPAGTITALTGLGTLLGGWNKPATPPGWQGTVGENALTAVRPGTYPLTFAPREYGAAPRVTSFSDVQYVPKGGAAVTPSFEAAKLFPGYTDPGDKGAFGQKDIAELQSLGASPEQIQSIGKQFQSQGLQVGPIAQQYLQAGELPSTGAFDPTKLFSGYTDPGDPMAFGRKDIEQLQGLGASFQQIADIGKQFQNRNLQIGPVAQEYLRTGILPVAAAEGGLMGLARGGRTLPPRYLRGETDGMADKLPSSIDGRQPAALSHGEFVVPADVVSHLGNGNSDAGAKVLYKMMDRVRQARTGSKRQGRKINPDRFTPGGIAGYAGGGAVAFDAGGATDTKTMTAMATPVTRESNLSSWIGPYVSDYLNKGQALSGMGYTPYMGPLTAGLSPTQQTALSTLSKPSFGSETFSATGAYAPPTATGAPGAGGGGGIAAQYMNPYLQSVLTPQLDELRRQHDISQQGLQAKFAQAGGLGGARDVIARTEGLRNLASQQANVVGQAYSSAYDKAMQQFNTEQQQRLANLAAQMGAGGIEQATEQKAVEAERGAFEEARMWPYKQLQFQQSLIQGLPVGTSTQSTQLSPFQQAGQIGGGLQDLFNVLKNIPGFGGK